VTTVFDYFCRRFPRIPADVWRRRFDDGKVWCDRGVFGPNSAFEPLLEVHYRREVDHEPPVRRDVREIYKDHDLLVVDKPPFLPVTPGGRWVRGCLLHLLEDHDLAPLHRLDRLTSGLVVLSRRPSTRGWWAGMFVPGAAIMKTYTAVCEVSGGEVPQQLVLEHHLARDPQAYWREQVVADLPANASCRIELLDRAERLALYRVEPTTGRKHQLRVQLAAAGLPILGDPLYGTDPRHDPGDLTRRMWLDAHRLVVDGFPRPEGGGQLSATWESSRPPADLFARALTRRGRAESP
jgi:tRNA pseudouridine32 synthase/23S rRNA pseudouridine746 synthase